MSHPPMRVTVADSSRECSTLRLFGLRETSAHEAVRGFQRRTHRVFVRIGMNGAGLPPARRKSMYCVECGKRRYVPSRVWTVGPAFTCRGCHRKRLRFYKRGTSRRAIGVGEARPVDVDTVPLSAVIPTLSTDEVRHLVLDLAYPFQYAVFCPALRYCPIISEHNAEIKAAKDAKQEATEHAESLKRLSEYLARSHHSPKIRRAILSAMQGKETLKVIAKRAGCSYNGLRVQIHRVCRNLAAEMEAAAEQETSK